MWLLGSNVPETLAVMTMAATSPLLHGLHMVRAETMDTEVATVLLAQLPVQLLGSNHHLPAARLVMDMAHILGIHPQLRRWVLRAHRRAPVCLLHRQACLRRIMALAILRLPHQARDLLLR